MEERNIIRCPSCGTSIDVNEVLYKEISEKIKIEGQKAIQLKEAEIKKQAEELRAQKMQMEKEKEIIETTIREEINKRLYEEKVKLEKEIKSKIVKENSEIIEGLQKEISEKQNQLLELKKVQLELERLKIEKEDAERRIILEKEKEYLERLKEERDKIRKNIAEESELKLKEKEKIIDDMKKELEITKRKAEQGSIQLQGEVQELELRDLLIKLYPYDEVSDVKTGQRGADVLQIVRNINGEKCGKIYYESKRTKEFQQSWIKKLKEDNLEVKADLLVIVTSAMPKEVEKFCYIDDVWICQFGEIQSLSLVLRHLLERTHSISETKKNKGTKMEMLYNYLTGKEFQQQFENIVRGFVELREGYAEERRKTMKLWKEREKQLDRILDSASEFYGSIRGIAGAAVPVVRELEDSSSLKSLKSPEED